jgi:hypothetical protein
MTPSKLFAPNLDKSVSWQITHTLRYNHRGVEWITTQCNTLSRYPDREVGFATMIKRERVLFKIAWVSLAITGVAILVFGLIATAWPASSDQSSLRAIGVASIGMGLFGVMITAIAYRRRERWAWFTLWYYPIFWIAHLLGGLPPGQEHVHQIVFIVLSLVGLLIPVGEFFPRGVGRRA